MTDDPRGYQQLETRAQEIIRLLETRDDGLPTPIRRTSAAPGFVNEASPRSCPDCLANGRAMIGCETCGGHGVVQPSHLKHLATVDECPDDGVPKDPYARNDKVAPYGFDASKHDAVHARDRQITVLEQQTRPPRSEAELLDEANQAGYGWEEQRRTMYRRFDYQALDRALDDLRCTDEGAYHALHSVYVYGWSEPSAAWESPCVRGLVFLDSRLPDPLRVPGKHPAQLRIERRAQKRRQAA